MGTKTSMAPNSVVDTELRVHMYRARELRVWDASVFPDIIGSYIRAPASVVTEKCAAVLRGDCIDKLVPNMTHAGRPGCCQLQGS